MPEIQLIPIPLYTGTAPIHQDTDNIPLRQINDRELVMNAAIDINAQLLRDSAGTVGSIAARLDQSILPSGDLKSEAIDEALHNIGHHTDGSFDGTDYVRMKLDERNKLELIDSEATNMTIEVETPSIIVLFEQGPVVFEPSPTLTWQVNGNKVKGNLNIPTSAAHQHFYDLDPVHDNIITPDFINYKVTSVSTPFVEDTLRVFINGVRLSSSDEIYVPGYLTTLPWKLLKFTPDHEGGTFFLSQTITSNDVIRVDFDLSLI